MSEIVPFEPKVEAVGDVPQIKSAMYDILERLSEDISTDSLQYIDRDVNLNNPDAVDEWRIDFSERDIYWWPAKAFVSAEYKLATLAAGALYAANENISIQNNGAGLFSRAELLIDDNIVEAVDHAHIQNTVRNLVYYSAEYSESIAKSAHWYPDTIDGSAVDYTITAGNSLFAQGIETVNTGHRALWKANLNSKINRINIPLANLFGLFKTMDTVTKGMKFSVRLFRNSPNDVVFRGAGAADGKVVFSKISLWMPRVKPHTSVLVEMEKKLRSEDSVFIPFVDTQITRTNKQLQTATGECFYQLKTKRRRPVKAFVCFQNAARVEGDQTNCKRIFDNIGITSLRAMLNSGTQFPERPLLPAFAATSVDISRIYEEFLRCGLKQHDGISGAMVDYDNFRTLFTIYCIDMSEQPDYAIKPESASLDIFWQHNAAADYYMWVLVEAERKLQILATGGSMKYVNVQ